MFDVTGALRELVNKEGSDLHVKAGSAPLFRVNGELSLDPSAEQLSPADTEGALRTLLRDETKLDEFAQEHEVDFAYEIEGVARFRINAFQQRGLISMACRAIPHRVSTIEELSLPPVVTELAEEERGIVLLTGTTGSGKSTTLAAMIDHMNFTMSKHIVTIEDPIEFLHSDKRSAINQREVGMDTASFKRALRRVLRQDPDVILIGEMRDAETIDTAMKAAETGHLLISTLHTPDAVTTVSRIVSMFPPEEQEVARLRLSEAVHAVVSQRLLPRADSHGRAAALEVLLATGAARDMIRDQDRTASLHDYIKESREQYGMQTFDQHLMDLVADDVVTYETGLAASSNPSDFQLQMKTVRRRSRVAPATQPAPATDDLSSMLPP